MSVFRMNLAATRRKCGSSLTGRLVETIQRERDGQRVEGWASIGRRQP